MFLLLCFGNAVESAPDLPNDPDPPQSTASERASSRSAPEPIVLIPTGNSDDDYDDADWQLTRLLGAGVVMLILCIGGLCLFRTNTFEEDQTIEYTRPVTTDDSFEFTALDGSDPKASLD
jgi:hypothetical protein